MHGKAQLEPARHSVVIDCKLAPLHNTCQNLSASPCGRAGIVSQCENFGGGQKIANCSQLFLDQSSPDLGTCRGLFPIVDIMFRCRDMFFGQSSKSVPIPKSGFCS